MRNKPFRPTKLEFYWIEPIPEKRVKRNLFNDQKFQLMRPSIRRDA